MARRNLRERAARTFGSGRGSEAEPPVPIRPAAAAAPRPPAGSASLLAAFRQLSEGEDLRLAGAGVIAKACDALGAVEGVMLLDGGGPGPRMTLTPAAHAGRAGISGALGSRPWDPDRVTEAAGIGAVTARAGRNGAEVWCPMRVEGRLVGVVGFRREEPFSAAELASVELLATGAALGADRLRFFHLWSDKLAQADLAHAQLLRYADDLRTTYASERRRAEEVVRALDALEAAYGATVRALASAMAEKDDVTGGHLTRVSAYGVEAARWFEPGLASTTGLEYAFLLHDVGKIGIPDAVLRKPGPLTDSEWELMREHPAIGLRILEGIPDMGVVRAVVGSHHERWDGAGYPDGLVRDEIPPAAQLFSAVDAFDAMTSDRPYRSALPVDEALARLGKAAGTQFAPDAVHAFLAVDRDLIDQIRTSVPRPAMAAGLAETGRS